MTAHFSGPLISCLQIQENGTTKLTPAETLSIHPRQKPLSEHHLPCVLITTVV